jgi:hypothetical protein
MTYYYEYCKTKTNRIGRMLTAEELVGKTGFSSIYGFDERTSAFFREAGTTRGAKHFLVYADSLFMDFDDAVAECERVVNCILEEGLKVKVYSSGGRGQHVQVFHQPLFDKRVPYSHRAWVESKGFSVDFCLYSHGHILRLPNTRHEKTGGYKELILDEEGERFELPLIEKPIRCYNQRSSGDFDLVDFSSMLNWFCSNLPANGARNHRLFALAAGLLASGISSTATVELVERINECLPEPLEDEELGLLLESAISTVGGVD